MLLMLNKWEPQLKLGCLKFSYLKETCQKILFMINRSKNSLIKQILLKLLLQIVRYDLEYKISPGNKKVKKL